jgi:hypothetical protein
LMSHRHTSHPPQQVAGSTFACWEISIFFTSFRSVAP